MAATATTPTPKTDLAWAREQLRRAGYTGPDGNARGQSLSTSVEILLIRLNDMALVGGDRHEVVQLFTRLASGAPISPANVTATAVWVDLTSRGSEVEVGHTVRVHPDAFEGAAGDDTNGRTGTLVDVRGGDYIINLAGATSDTPGLRLKREHVQVLARTTR